MMHNKGLVACIKVGGRILREQSERVYLPFGSEYSVYLKNLEHRRVRAKIFIDGANVSDNGFIIDGSSSINIERFIKNGNLLSGNRFKFIERTEAIEKHRGIEAEDGLVRIEYQFEKLPPKIEYQKTVHVHEHVYHDYPYWYYPIYRWPCHPYHPYIPPTICGSTLTNTSSQNDHSYNATCRSLGSQQMQQKSEPVILAACNMSDSGAAGASFSSAPLNDVGITVPGSESSQQFRTVYGFDPESETHVMVLHLIGEVTTNRNNKVPVAVPITVQKKSTCNYCGKTNKSSSKYCSQCGASVTVL